MYFIVLYCVVLFYINCVNEIKFSYINNNFQRRRFNVYFSLSRHKFWHIDVGLLLVYIILVGVLVDVLNNAE